MSELCIIATTSGGARNLPATNITLTANAWGSDRASFDLHRSLEVPWSDLVAFTPITVDCGGVPVWSGRIRSTPGRDAGGQTITVNCEGWQYHLDDKPYPRLYVHTQLGDWIDARSLTGQNLVTPNGYIQAGQVSSDGAITLGFPEGASVENYNKAGVVLDLGSNVTGKRVVITWDSSNNDSTDSRLIVYGYDGEDTSAAPGLGADAQSVQVANNSAASGTSTVTFNTARRYIAIATENNGTATRTLTADVWFRVKTVQVFSATAYESGNASVLKAETVLADVLTQGLPMLSSATTLIGTTGVAIPDLFDFQGRSPREWAERVNAPWNYVLKVTPEKHLKFAAKPTSSLYSVGAWAPYSFEDASLNSGDDLYNSAVVSYRDGTGKDTIVERTQTVDVLSGFTRRKILSLPSRPLNTTLANQIGDTFLATHDAAQLNGSVAIPDGALRGNAGEYVHPSRLLRDTGELLRLSDRVDPTSGSLGRMGFIVNVSYSDQRREAQVELDNSTRTYERLLARSGLSSN